MERVRVKLEGIIGFWLQSLLALWGVHTVLLGRMSREKIS